MRAKKKIKKYEKLWITKNSDNDYEKYMKIKFNSTDELPLNKNRK